METLKQPSEPQGTTLALERPKRRAPVALLALVALLAIVGVSLTVFKRSVVYYKTPTEVLASSGTQVRLSGKVVPGSVAFDPARGLVSFVVTDGTTKMPVRFAGPAPDTLKDDAEAVAEGTLGADGTFEAKKLFARCPSKFATKKSGG